MTLTLGASVWYLALSLLLAALAWFRASVSRDGALAMLIWYCLINAIYQPGVIEWRETILCGLAFAPVCGYLLWRYDHWLPILLTCVTVAHVFWALTFREAWFNEPAYAFKAVRNAIALTGYAGVGASLVPWGGAWSRIRKK